jgi:hypothetical protein
LNRRRWAGNQTARCGVFPYVTAIPIADSESADPTEPSIRDLLARARRLRAIARVSDPIVGQAYRRRAAELQLQAWAWRVRAGDRVS